MMMITMKLMMTMTVMMMPVMKTKQNKKLIIIPTITITEIMTKQK